MITIKITEQVRLFAEPVVAELGLNLWDVEYIREGGDWFLRLYIDKEDGVGIADCEAVSRAIDPILDEKDPIPDSYHFEVSSAGLERVLKRPDHFEKSMGKDILVKLYSPLNGQKEYTGKLASYDGTTLALETPQETMTFEIKAVALVRLVVTF